LGGGASSILLGPRPFPLGPVDFGAALFCKVPFVLPGASSFFFFVNLSRTRTLFSLGSFFPPIFRRIINFLFRVVPSLFPFSFLEIFQGMKRECLPPVPIWWLPSFFFPDGRGATMVWTPVLPQFPRPVFFQWTAGTPRESVLALHSRAV